MIADESSYDAIYKRYYNRDTDIIEDANLYAQLQNATGWDSNGDITLSGDKYRRMKKSDATFEISGYDYYYNWKDSSSYHYFKYEPIKWRVLDVNGTDAFLLADRALDDQRYNIAYADITWEKSTMRSWLNGYSSSENTQAIDYTGSSFINSAFTSSQRNAVKTTDIVNDDNIKYGTEGGNDTKDKVFLLSESEVYDTTEAESYGFVKVKSTYDEGRRSKSSTYAKAMGTYSNISSIYSDNCWWWLRSPGGDTSHAAGVYYDGYVHYGGNNVSYGDKAVRPALYLNISSSDLWSYAGTVCSDGSATVAVDKVTLDKSSLTLEKGTSEKLSATISPSDATNKNVTWTSDNEAVATVSTDGTVKAVHTGTAKITVTTEDGGHTASCAVTVEKADPQYTPPENLVAYCGDKLSDVHLPDGFEWNDASLPVGKVGVNTFKATYIPEDTSDYNTISDIELKVTVSHKWNETETVDKEPTCTEAGSKSIHCSICDAIKDSTAIPMKAHDYESHVIPATVNDTGRIIEKCSACGYTGLETVVASPKSFTLSADTYVYSGSAKTPSVSVKDTHRQALEQGTDYTVSYQAGRKKVGRYAVKITLMGCYEGEQTLYFTINPKSTSLSTLTAAKKGLTAKWKKQSTQTSGYQIMYATNSKFTSGQKTVTVSSNKTISKKITKLKAKKKYYVRVRTYKKVGSTKYYSSWSKVKTVKTK